jgi:hypothetical protein
VSLYTLFMFLLLSIGQFRKTAQNIAILRPTFGQVVSLKSLE